MQTSATRLAKPLQLLAALGLLALNTACMPTMYVDNGLKDVAAAEMVKVTNPKPVQLLFEFRTKGTINGRATDMLRAQAQELVSGSGLFSQVGTAGAGGADGALLSIVVDNVPITSESDAAAKGFATGLTFGLVGSAVTDGYICTATFVPGAAATPIKKEVRHALHATFGAKGAPPNSTKAKNMDEAVRTMLRQIVNNALQAIGSDPQFAGTGT